MKYILTAMNIKLYTRISANEKQRILLFPFKKKDASWYEHESGEVNSENGS